MVKIFINSKCYFSHCHLLQIRYTIHFHSFTISKLFRTFSRANYIQFIFFIVWVPQYWYFQTAFMLLYFCVGNVTVVVKLFPFWKLMETHTHVSSTSSSTHNIVSKKTLRKQKRKRMGSENYSWSGLPLKSNELGKHISRQNNWLIRHSVSRVNSCSKRKTVMNQILYWKLGWVGGLNNFSFFVWSLFAGNYFEIDFFFRR